MRNENIIRKHWCSQLWQRKGYDSPDEFMQHGNCFACGLNDGVLQVRSVSQGDAISTHLLCNHCHDDSKGLKGFSYLRWFLKRTASQTIAAHMFKRVAGLTRSADTH